MDHRPLYERLRDAKAKLQADQAERLRDANRHGLLEEDADFLNQVADQEEERRAKVRDEDMRAYSAAKEALSGKASVPSSNPLIEARLLGKSGQRGKDL
jgi:hypothetical protein